MKYARKWWKSLVVLVALLAVIQGALSILARTGPVHRYLTEHLERSFGRSVEVGHFNILLLPAPRMDAERVTIVEDPSFGNEYFLRADRLSAGVSWTDFLRGHFGFGTLTFNRPSLILVRGADARSNLERWLPPAKGTGALQPFGARLAAGPASRLHRIIFEDGRINFKQLTDKLPFAFTGVSGSVEQLSSGLWNLKLEAEPWSSGSGLQSAGTISVWGDIAGTSSRLRPAELHVHWSDASVADVLRLVSGHDYGARGVFALDASVKSTDEGAPASGPGLWKVSARANAAQIHRWDLPERGDNPHLNLSLSGIWNSGTGQLRVEHLLAEAPKSRLTGDADFSMGVPSSRNVRIASANVQASDLLAWYRAFTPGVDDGLSIQEFLAGSATLRGWPLTIEDAEVSSDGGVLQVPGLDGQLQLAAFSSSSDQTQFSLGPLHVSHVSAKGKQPSFLASLSASAEASGGSADQIAFYLGFTHDFQKHRGSLSIGGDAENVQEILKLAAAFGRPLNQGWDLKGAASASLRWDWANNPLQGRWNGTADFSKAELQVAGLNSPLQVNHSRVEWKDGIRTADLSDIEGLGTTWSGTVRQLQAADREESPVWNVRLHGKHLDASDLDRWIGPRARPNWLQRLLPALLGGGKPSFSPSALLGRINAEGEITLDEFVMERLRLSQVRAKATLRDLRLEITGADAKWDGGKVHASALATFLPRPVYEVTADAERLNIDELTADSAMAGQFGGFASAHWRLTARGVGRDELLDTLAGSGDVQLHNAEFRGWDVGAMLAEGEAQSGLSKWPDGEGRFAIADRKIVVPELRLDRNRSTDLVRGTVTFAQQVNLVLQIDEGRLHMASAAGRKLTKLKISGPMKALQFSIEQGANSRPVVRTVSK